MHPCSCQRCNAFSTLTISHGRFKMLLLWRNKAPLCRWSFSLSPECWEAVCCLSSWQSISVCLWASGGVWMKAFVYVLNASVVIVVAEVSLAKWAFILRFPSRFHFIYPPETGSCSKSPEEGRLNAQKILRIGVLLMLHGRIFYHRGQHHLRHEFPIQNVPLTNYNVNANAKNYKNISNIYMKCYFSTFWH